MHSVVITKVEYRPVNEENFTTLDIIPQSGLLNEESVDTKQGPLNKISAQFDKAGVTAQSDILMKKLRGQKFQFRFTDSNAVVHLVGDEYYCARLTYRKVIPETPGSFNGYNCTVTCNTPAGSSVS